MRIFVVLQMKSTAKIDMLSGPLLPRMLLFALPLIASGVSPAIVQLCRRCGRWPFRRRHALAAVGCTGPVIGLLINLFVGISVGVNVVIANYIGQRNGQGVRKAVSATMVLSVICGVLMLLVGESMARPVLELTGTPAEVLDDAVRYMRVFVLGLPFHDCLQLRLGHSA